MSRKCAHQAGPVLPASKEVSSISTSHRPSITKQRSVVAEGGALGRGTEAYADKVCRSLGRGCDDRRSAGLSVGEQGKEPLCCPRRAVADVRKTKATAAHDGSAGSWRGQQLLAFCPFFFACCSRGSDAFSAPRMAST